MCALRKTESDNRRCEGDVVFVTFFVSERKAQAWQAVEQQRRSACPATVHFHDHVKQLTCSQVVLPCTAARLHAPLRLGHPLDSQAGGVNGQAQGARQGAGQGHHGGVARRSERHDAACDCARSQRVRL